MTAPITRPDLEWSSPLMDANSDSDQIQEQMPQATPCSGRFVNQRIKLVLLGSVLLLATLCASAPWPQSTPLGGRPKSAMILELLEGDSEPDVSQDETLDEASEAATDNVGSNGSAATPAEKLEGDLVVDSNGSAAGDLPDSDSENSTNESVVAQDEGTLEHQHPPDVAWNDSVAASGNESESSTNETERTSMPEQAADEVQDDAEDRNLLLVDPASQLSVEDRGQEEDIKQATDKSDAIGQQEVDAGLTDNGCGPDEDLFMALCYTSCASLTKEEYPHRMSPLSCCKVQDLGCLTQPGQSITRWELGGASPASPHPPKWSPGLYIRQATR